MNQLPLSRARFRRSPVALVAMLYCGAVAAQQATVQAQGTTARSSLAEVTVSGDRSGRTEGSGSYTAEQASTATRMDLSIRETPQSVSVVTRERMDDMGLTRIDQVLGQTTGIMIGQADSERVNYSARGFSINNFQIDGMPRGLNAPLSDTVLYDRIEVVRGATGLMGGTGDPSATINSVRKRPTREFQGSASLSYGRWNQKRAEVDISAPLTADGRIRARTALAFEDRDSYMDMYHERKTVGMVIVEADLTRSTLLTAGVDFQNNKPKGATWGAVPYWNFDGTLANLPRNTSLSTPWSTWANQQQTAFVSLQHRFDNDWKVHLGYARTTSKNNTTVGYGGAGYPNPFTGKGMSLWTGSYGEGTYVNDNFDLYATGPFNLLGRRHTFIAGWNGGTQTYTSPGGRVIKPYPDAIPDYRVWTGAIMRPYFQADGSRSEGFLQLGGGYVAGRFSIADPLSVIVGARVSNYRTYTRGYNSLGQYTRTTGKSEARDEITPYVGVVYDIDKQHSAYASFTTLFRPQTVRDKNDRFLDPETGSSAELGVKGEYFGGLLNASTAVFQVKKKNLAELDRGVPSGFRLSDGSQAYVASGDGITARGIEFDVSGQITPAWNVNAGYTYLDAKTAKGERAVPNQPKHLLRLSTAYRFSGDLKGLKVGGGVTAQSGIYGISWYGQPPLFNMDANARIAQKSYAVFNLMASYEINKNLTAQLNVNNLFDKKYYRNVGFYDSVFWGEPRSFNVSLRAKF
jgi:outer membrane receptor for ferric coprogen and ferric-rhodotorulic acid